MSKDFVSTFGFGRFLLKNIQFKNKIIALVKTNPRKVTKGTKTLPMTGATIVEILLVVATRPKLFPTFFGNYLDNDSTRNCH